MMNQSIIEANTIANNNYNAEQLLQFMVSTGMISLDAVANEMKNTEKQKIISAHPHPITQGKDGRWRTYVDKPEGGRRQIAKSSREKVEDALMEYYGQSIKDIVTLESLYPEWIEYKKLHGITDTYIIRINSNWRNYYADSAIVTKPIEQLDKYTLDVWVHQLIKQVGHKKKEYYNISGIMRQILDFAVNKGMLKDNPLKQVNIDRRRVFAPKKKKASETQVFSRKELEELKDVATKEFLDGHNTVHKLAPLAIMFQFQTGLRVGELCALRYEDINDDELDVNRMYRYATKEVVDYLKGHNEGRTIPLTDEAKRLIAEAKKYQQEHGMPDDGYIFSVNSEPLSYYTVKKSYTRYCNMIGTAHKSSHKARKTFISALIDGQVNINTVREIVGHADERTTYASYCYDRRTKSDRAELVKKALS